MVMVLQIAEGKLGGISDQCISAARSTVTGTPTDNCTATYFDHVLRARNLCIEILEERLDGKRRRGRSRRRWTDDIKDWSNRMAECSRLARDRQ